jgi:hypothetical protein
MLTLRLQTPIAVVVLEGAQNLLGTGLTMHALQSLDPNLVISPEFQQPQGTHFPAPSHK